MLMYKIYTFLTKCVVWFSINQLIAVVATAGIRHL